MPLAGGPSDKAGNSYERRWTVFTIIDLLDGRAQSLRIEVPGDEGSGAEFRLSVGGISEWHQAKRQRAAGPWSINAMATAGILAPWWSSISAGGTCVFVSSSGAPELLELTERAAAAQSWDEFHAEFLGAEEWRKSFERLRRAWGDPPDPSVYEALLHIKVRPIGEAELAQWIEDRLRALTAGGYPATAAAVLAQLADDSVHRELSPADVWAYLASHGITPRDLDRDAALIHRVTQTTVAYLGRLRPLYIGGREILRAEASTAFEHLARGDRVLLAGAAGIGKSAVTTQVIARAQAQGWPVLVLSADRLPEVDTTRELGSVIGFPDSPATVLAGVAAGGDALLIIDQLDAVSVVSGRHPERLGILSDLLNEASSYPAVRVLLACRQFDLDHDRQLRAVARTDRTVAVAIDNLDEVQVREALAEAGLSEQVPPPLIPMLVVPLHLALYVDLVQAGFIDVHAARSLTELFNGYWTSKRDACRTARGGCDEWVPVIERLVQWMSERQQLSVPAPLLDEFDQQVKVMASEGVLSVGQGRIGFFHETFFDYCFARHFVSVGKTLRELLTASEQDLFRRAQVRQVLTYQRVTDFSAYLQDFVWLVDSPDVRLHIKAFVVALLDTLANPTTEEWNAMRAVANDAGSPLHHRLWRALRTNPAWFPVLDENGEWEAWLRNEATADRALWALTGITHEHGHRTAELLGRCPPEVWRSRRRGFLGIAEVHATRDLFDLLLAAIVDGDYDHDQGSDLWHHARLLAEQQPAWATEMLSAVLARAIRRAAEEDVSPFDVTGPLHRHGQQMTAATTNVIATAAPAEFVERLLPQLLGIMRSNEQPDWGDGDLIPDAIWHTRIHGTATSLRDQLFEGMCRALATLAAGDPVHAARVFDVLKADRHEAAAFLLARGYLGNAAAFADDAADWLAGTAGTLRLGYSGSTSWTSRELIAAISPCCSPERFDRLVSALMFYAPRWERTRHGMRARGHTELCLLNGLDPGRRPDRVERRIAELRRKFGYDDAPPPQGVTGGVVPPPIPEDKARRMTDRQWLRAMQRYGSGDLSWRDGGFVGDASTQAQVLEALTKEKPDRFAQLLLSIPTGIAEAYISALLRGLAGARLDSELLTAVCRHAQQIGGSDSNRWLVRLIESHAAGTVPDELLEIVVEIAGADPDPHGRQGHEVWNGGSIDSAGLNSTRGAAALAISRLIAEEPGRLVTLTPALKHLVADEQPEVRAATAAALAPILYHDPDLAIALFGRASAHVTDELVGSRYMEHFLRHAVATDRFADVSALLFRMTGSNNEDARKAGARQLTLASFHDLDIDSAVDALLASPDDTVRATAVSVFADNVTNARPPKPQHDRRLRCPP